MFQRFFESSIECKFIKSLLYNTNLPLLNTITANELMIKGICYVYKNDIIKCTKTGYLSETVLKCCKNAVCNNTLLVGSTHRSYNLAEYEIVQPYDFGRYYPQLTQRYIPRNAYYDNETHRFLGDYLRCYRDLYDIDLMPFYNCYNYETFNDFHLKQTFPGWENSENKAVKLLAVPIKFNKTYTIAIDSPARIICKAVLHNDFGMMKKKNSEGEYEYLTDLMSKEYLTVTMGGKKKSLKDGGCMCFVEQEGSCNCADMSFLCDCNNYKIEGGSSYIIENPIITTVDGASFCKPFKFRIENNNYDFQKLEKYLYLAIQVPAESSSSVVVLEGNYGNTYESIIDVSSIDKLPLSEINELLTSKLGLLMINTEKIYAFSNRLIEYLLLNVITNRDDIRNNIGTIQDKAFYSDYNSSYIHDVWDNGLRYNLYMSYMKEPKTNKIDINGFIDKDMENFVHNYLYKQRLNKHEKIIEEAKKSEIPLVDESGNIIENNRASLGD